MNWQIKVPIPAYEFNISHSDKVFSVGSCFAQHMADKLVHYKFSCNSNPYGTLFHPIPLLQNLTNALTSSNIDDELFVESEDAIFHYSCHSSVWANTQDDLQEQITAIQTGVRNDLQEANLIILTFGTAFLYQLISSNQVVANCHKQPQSTFTKNCSSPNEIVSVFTCFYNELKRINPKATIVLTVSPVRHIRDGVHQNNVSKSSLILACEAIENTFNDVHYFPAYEIVLDELRDYRFFDKDRVHPTQEARDYVWEKFSVAIVSPNSLQINKELDQLFSSMNHRAFRAGSSAHQSFLRKTLAKATHLNNKVNLEKEINVLKRSIQ